jgi:hypothetical protein
MSSETSTSTPPQDVGAWKVYIHLTTDSDWSVSSYKVVDSFSTLDGGIVTLNAIPSTCVENGMLFMMRGGVKPVWEDPANRDGGCFSFKIDSGAPGGLSAQEVFHRTCLAVLSRSVGRTEAFMDAINGVTISPKSNFHILKLWMRNKVARRIEGKLACAADIGLDPRTCVFKEHQPEF